jgi:hypothetical protein
MAFAFVLSRRDIRKTCNPPLDDIVDPGARLGDRQEECIPRLRFQRLSICRGVDDPFDGRERQT